MRKEGARITQTKPGGKEQEQEVSQLMRKCGSGTGGHQDGTVRQENWNVREGVMELGHRAQKLKSRSSPCIFSFRMRR